MFERIRDVYLDDEEYVELQQFMMQNPEAGKVVRGSVQSIRQDRLWVLSACPKGNTVNSRR